jgi:hypothetical protein
MGLLEAALRVLALELDHARDRGVRAEESSGARRDLREIDLREPEKVVVQDHEVDRCL